MVRYDLQGMGIRSPRVLEAMRQIPRHLFVPGRHRSRAYEDIDIPISQFLSTPRPFIVARTLELLELTGREKILEVGTGRGYQTALLADLADEVYSIEIVPSVAKDAQALLRRLHFKKVHVRIGDGYKGWPDAAPFDAILVMASARAVPKPLLDQLSPGGRLVMPVGSDKDQSLVLYRKTATGLKKISVMPVHLKPLEGQAAGHYWE